eukprot:Skav209643  [mRNA]  locus=scaffold650:23767:24258:- [translate_table: standard]
MSFSAKAYQLPEDGHVKVHVAIDAVDDPSRRWAANLCLVIDVSGSMQLPAVLKDREAAELSILDIVVHSCRTVIHSLDADDQLGIVTYSDSAEVKLELTAMDDDGKAKAEAALGTLRADGQTNLWLGFELVFVFSFSDFEILSFFHADFSRQILTFAHSALLN